MKLLTVFGIVCCGVLGLQEVVSHLEFSSSDALRTKRNANTPICQDKYAAIPGHTMCLANIQNHHPINNSAQDAIVAKHNAIRGSVNPPAANMLEISYFKALEIEAQIWAEQCKLTHDPPSLRILPGSFTVGQNIATHTAPMSWNQVIDLWASESQHFTYGSANKFQDVGHYTQLVWAMTSLVGCGSAKCGSTYFYVCNYGPSGNENQFDKPYVTGNLSVKGCSTTTKLCGCAGKFCMNGGLLNLATCQCDCNKDVKRYYNELCDLECVADGDNPLCGIYPYSKGSCRSNKDAIYNCPWLCNVCPYAGTNYTEGSVPLPSTGKATQTCMLTVLLASIATLVLSKMNEQYIS